MLMNFKKQFAEMVKSGAKKQTIRAIGKHKPRVGEIAYLYTGLRTKHCQRLGMGKITDVLSIRIEENPPPHIMVGYVRVSVIRWLNSDEIKVLAQSDGFNTADELFDFIRKAYGFPFNGYIIKWQ